MLKGKVTLVTDAGRRIGCQITLTLGREGAAVIMNYNGSAVEAGGVVKEIEAVEGEAEAVQCSVSDFENCGRMMADMVPRYDRLGILVNGARITRDNLLIRMSKEDFDAIISMNLKGVFNCTKHISRQMLKQKAGRIISIPSASGALGNVGQANYYTAKAGAIGTIKSTARELASRGVTVDAVAPSFITTEMIDVLSDDVKAAATEQTLVKYFGNTQNITETVAFLASDEAGYITGQVLSVDGGMAM